jgi:hypothetical protein
MTANPNVLVVAVVGDTGWRIQIERLCHELCDRLQEEPSIVLGSRMPVDPNLAGTIIADCAEPPVIVLVGDSHMVRNASAALVPLLGEVPLIPVVFDEGMASLSVGNAEPTDIIGLIRVAVESLGRAHRLHETVRSGEVIQLGSRTSNDARENTRETEQDNDGSGSRLPVPAEEGVNVNVRRTLRTAVEWADAATGVLVDIWSNREEEESAVYGLSWDGLMASVERLLGIRDAPMEKAHEKFRLVKAMLVHPSADQTPLVILSRLLGRDDLSMKLLMIVLAPELDIRFQRLFGALHDDMGRRYVSMGLACAILAAATEEATPSRIRSEISALATLRDFRLIEGVGDSLPAADEALRIDPRLLDWVVTGKAERLTAEPAFDAILRPSPGDALALLPADRKEEIRVALNHGVKRHGDSAQLAAIVITGSEPGWIEVEASALAGAELRIAPPAAELSAEILDRTLREAVRASRLRGHRLVVDMLDPGPNGPAFWRKLAPLLPLCRPKPYVISDNPAWLLSLIVDERIAVAPLPPVGQSHRIEAIAAAIRPDVADETQLAALIAERFRVPLLLLPDVPPLARAEAAMTHLGIPDGGDWTSAFRKVAGSRLPQLARRVPPRPRPAHGSQLDRVILPKEQRRLLETMISHVKVGGKVLRDWHFGDLLGARGVSVLFSGESGTGKTIAAHAVASELGTDLYVVDLARMVSKYIGETEKNLEIIFTEAERAGAVLLFDEADALFGKRSAVGDAHDRYANIEVAYLLQRVETYDGLAILTTNHPGNIDPAFTRRLRFTIDFPFPSPQDRLRIWEQAIPRGSPQRGPELDFALAARRLEVNGGSIRQIVLHALMAAADTKDGVVRCDHLREAARTELARFGKYDKLQGVGDLFCGPVKDRAA